MSETERDDPGPQDEQMDDLLRRFARETSEAQGDAHGDFAARMRTRLREQSRRPPGQKGQVAETKCASARRRRISPLLLAAAALVLVAAVSFLMLRRSGPAGTLRHQVGTVTVEGSLEGGDLRLTTAAAGRCLYGLDGERIALFLNEDSSLVIASPGEIQLDRGEVWITVRPKSGPFAVQTAEARIDVIGTVFSVRLASPGTTVMVESGRVSVQNGCGIVGVEAGQAARVPNRALEPVIEIVENPAVPDWAWELYNGATGANQERYYPSSHK